MILLTCMIFFSSCVDLEPNSPEAKTINRMFKQKPPEKQWYKNPSWQKQLLIWARENNYPPLKGLIEQFKMPPTVFIKGKPLINWVLDPMHVPKIEDQCDFLKYLLLKGANPNARNKKFIINKDVIPLEYAIGDKVSVTTFQTLLRWGYRTIDKWQPFSEGNHQMSAEQWLINEKQILEQKPEDMTDFFYALSIVRKLEIFYSEQSLSEIQIATDQHIKHKLTQQLLISYDTSFRFK